MKPLPLNLASRPFRNNLLVGTLLTVVGAALIGGTAFNLYVYLSYGAAYATLQRAQEEDRARIAELQKQERDLSAQIKTRDFRNAYGRGKLASELIRKSAFSWTQLFNTLETVIPPDVVLAAIRPNISSDGIVLRIEGIAKSHLALLTLEEKLQGHDAFKKVAPISERKLNPNLPDITFLVSCDYIPPSLVPPAVTAANETGGNAAAAPAGDAGPAAAAGDPAASTAAPGTNASESPAAGSAPGSTDAAAGPAPSSPVAGAVVGRDGRPKTAASSVIAPGGLLIAEAVAAPGPSARKGGARKPAAGTTTSPSATVPAPAPVPQQLASQQAPAPAPGKGHAPAPTPAVAVPPAQRPIATPRGYDPNVPRTMPSPLQTAVNRPKAGAAPARAERLDVPLAFVGRPAAEVYRTLAEAHGVRIDLDPTVDPSAPVTANLQGRKLEEALLLLSGVLHTQMTHPSEGVYRITSTEVRSPAGDKPPIEEPIVEDGQR
jgi:Tfp pilus assembly protein PilN